MITLEQILDAPHELVTRRQRAAEAEGPLAAPSPSGEERQGLFVVQACQLRPETGQQREATAMLGVARLAIPGQMVELEGTAVD